MVVDDIALPLGRIRVRPHGSDGGHNGLRSLVAALGTEEYARVRVGVGPEEPPDMDLADFVLAEFLDGGAAAAARGDRSSPPTPRSVLIQEGAETAMNRFNGRRV